MKPRALIVFQLRTQCGVSRLVGVRGSAPACQGARATLLRWPEGRGALHEAHGGLQALQNRRRRLAAQLHAPLCRQRHHGPCALRTSCTAAPRSSSTLQPSVAEAFTNTKPPCPLHPGNIASENGLMSGDAPTANSKNIGDQTFR